MKKIFIPIIAFIIICINVNAQEKSRKELKGNKYYSSYSFTKAISSYTQAKHLSIEGLRMLAASYHNINQNIQSEEVYSRLVNEQEVIVPEDYYNYALVLKANGKYEESSKWMVKFCELSMDDLRAMNFNANINNLPNLLKDDGKYKIVHMNVNNDAADFGTCYFKDKIVFSSTRTTQKLFVKKYAWTGKPFWDMYISEVAEGQMKTPINFDENLNGKFNDGPASFSNGGNYIAFTRNNYKVKRKDKLVDLQIFFSSYKNGEWSKSQPFALNSKEYSVGHPCLTEDGNTMYFTSDMPGGFGRADIYRTTKNDQGEWTKPENLGDRINTEGDEMFPFIENNNSIFYFTSNGHFGLGGLDIFICSISNSKLGHVYNAGFPLNTQYDDFALIVDNKLHMGYFTSNRIGGSGDDDIYSVEILDREPKVVFTVNAPKNIPIERRVRETFPLRNYVFFNLGSTEIPDRYVLLNKDQVKDFKEDQLEVFIPKNFSGRSKRQLTVYYNVLNILGDRMGKNSNVTIGLTGSSMEGEKTGIVMAESVKKYLVNVFGIEPSRINTEGRLKPRIPSEQPGGLLELDLLHEGDNRVSIWSTSPEILMEFQSGPNAPLKPIEIQTVQEAPIDSYVSFYVNGGKNALLSWSLEITDSIGEMQKFGPYTEEIFSIPGKSILGVKPKGDYKIAMIGQTKMGNTIKMDTTVTLNLWTPSNLKDGLRFSIIYEFNDSRAINIYEKYLTNIVVPMIAYGAKVIISGYTDIIGRESNNYSLSLARANDVKSIIKKALLKAGRSDVTIEVYGFGEDQDYAPFDNKFPEERFYNRTVIIDIIPAK